MQYHQFMGHVQHRARLASFEDAVRATRATLETLGERLFGGEAANLASQLPQEIGLYLTDPDLRKEAFSLDEFFRRVAIRENVNYSDAVFHAREVLAVVDEAVAPGLAVHVCDQLPSDYDQLFEACRKRAGMTAEDQQSLGLEDFGGIQYDQGGTGSEQEQPSSSGSDEASRLAQEDLPLRDFPLQE